MNEVKKRKKKQMTKQERVNEIKRPKRRIKANDFKGGNRAEVNPSWRTRKSFFFVIFFQFVQNLGKNQFGKKQNFGTLLLPSPSRHKPCQKFIFI